MAGPPPLIYHRGKPYPLLDTIPGRQVAKRATNPAPSHITIGDSARENDRRTRSIIITSWQPGMGTDFYDEGQISGPAPFAISDWDTRYGRALVPPPDRRRLGPAGALGSNLPWPWRVEYLGFPRARLLAWHRGFAPCRTPGATTQWITPGTRSPTTGSRSTT